MIIDRLSKSYTHDGQSIEVLTEFSLEVKVDSIVALVGPSGCGKTTLLRLISSLEAIESGAITYQGMESEGSVSYLFQEPRLLPGCTLTQNISIPLKRYYPVHQERVEKAEEFLSLVDLWEFRNAYPHQLSGGMRQRAAIARSFAYPSHTMLLDEPFQSLDAELRWSLVRKFAQLYESHRRTTLFVTHDIQEALLLADTVVQLSKRPMNIVESTEITIPRTQRSLRDPSLLSLIAPSYTYP